MKGMSLGAYARHRKTTGLTGGTRQAVSQSIKRWSLLRSVVRVDDSLRITSPSAADEEWRANTDTTRLPITVQMRAAEAATAQPWSEEDVEYVRRDMVTLDQIGCWALCGLVSFCVEGKPSEDDPPGFNCFVLTPDEALTLAQWLTRAATDAKAGKSDPD